MTLSNSQSSSGNSNNDVLTHRTSSNSRNCNNSGGPRRNNCDRGQSSKNLNSQYHNKPNSESERHLRSFNSAMPTASGCSYNSSDMNSINQISATDTHSKSKDACLDDRLYKTAPESVDPSILRRGSACLIKRYTRPALYLLRNDTRSRCRPKCASKLQLLCIWKTNFSNNCHQNGGNSNNTSHSSNSMEMSSSVSSPRMSSISRQQSNHELQAGGSSASGNSHHNTSKNFIDHRSMSSSHLMPAFAKRRIGSSMQMTSGNSTTGGPCNPSSNESLKYQGASGKNNDQKQYLSPQRKNVNLNQMSKSVQLNSSNSLESDREHDRERGQELDVKISSSNPCSSNARERRIGSGRVLPRDVNWDYHSEKDSNSTLSVSGSMPFEKDFSSHSSSGGNNTQRVSSNSNGNQNSNSRYDYSHRSPSSKERIPGGSGKNSSDYRSESRYESRRSYARDYERDNRGDNSNYVRRFMSDLINQNSNSGFGKSNSSGQNHSENRRRHTRNDEPEWFSNGPTSQHDTIELGGFDEIDDTNSNSSGSGACEEKGKRGNIQKQSTKKYKENNSQTKSQYDLSPNHTTVNKESASNESCGSSVTPLEVDESKTVILTAHNTPSLNSDTNNNSKHKNFSYNTNKQSIKSEENFVSNESKTDDIKSNLDSDAKKDTATNSTSETTCNQKEDKATGFNIDAFLNVDPLSNLLMGEKNPGDSEVGSRFSRWFANQGDNVKICNDNGEPSTSEEMALSLDVEPQVTNNERDSGAVPESANANQSNTLMEFLQRSKINTVTGGNAEPIANVGSIPSVEELEARMRKIGEGNNALNRELSNMNDNINNPLNQFLNSNVQHQQQQQQQKHLQHFVVKNSNQAVSIPNILSSVPQLQQQPHLQLNHPHHGVHFPPSQAQDMEAFKKLLEQITPTALSAVKMPTQNPIQQMAPPQQMHRIPALPQPNNNILTPIPAPNSQHIMKNDEINKFMQQQQLQRRQPHVMTGAQHPPINQPTPNEMPIVQAMFLPAQQRYEAQLLLQGLSRGDISQGTLGHQLNNPNTSPRTKEVLAAVLRESSRDTSPNVIMSAPQIMSPVLGQSHCGSNIPPPPPPIMIPSPQQMPFNHPPQPVPQQPLPSSGTNAGGLPQRIPSPRELQYHTQSIMQNALIKKKLEEQQENFRRRQELQKQQQQMQQHKPLQSPSHVEMNEFAVIVGPPQQQYSQNQHQKKSTQQQQIIQSQQHQQQQQRHVNSPTPLAFTPTSVLRKMTAEKEVAAPFHAPTPIITSAPSVTGTVNSSPLIATSSVVVSNVGVSNSNPNKPMHSLFMHYQQQQQPNPHNQPRMILGVGNQQQQQHQQQPGVPMLSGQQLQQQSQPEHSRLNSTMRNNQIKWTGAIMNQIPITKPMGRPILKGTLTQTITSPNNAGMNAVHQQQQQTQPMQPQPAQMTFASKIEFQQIQQQRVTNSQQPPPHQQQKQQHQQQQPQAMPPQQQSQNILMTQIYQQRAAMQRAQYQLHQLHQQHQQQQQQQQQHQQMNIIQNNNRSADRINTHASTSQPVSSCGNIINYQRDGGLSPTSNQLARWFSPELLAQASAGKLPPLNMNQALSLEEFEKSIQHSSTVVNN